MRRIKRYFGGKGHQQTVLHKGWKLIRAEQSHLPQPAPMAKWLFNLAVDPTEQTNLAVRIAIRWQSWRHCWQAIMRSKWSPCGPAVFNSPQLIDKTSNEPLEEGDEFIYWPN